MSKLIKSIDGGEMKNTKTSNDAFWASVVAAIWEVEQWPQWKKDGARRGPRETLNTAEDGRIMTKTKKKRKKTPFYQDLLTIQSDLEYLGEDVNYWIAEHAHVTNETVQSWFRQASVPRNWQATIDLLSLRIKEEFREKNTRWW